MPQKLLMFEANYNTTHYTLQTTMTQIALATLEALISLELMALATISKVKAVTLKTWQQLATKYQHLASDTCTVNENDSQFVLTLPTLPEKVQPEMFDPEYKSDGMVNNVWGTLDIDLDDESDVTVTGYQVAQWLTIFFYGFLQSVLLPYCLDSLDRVIQIAHNVRFVLVYHVTNDDSFVFIDIGETA